MTLSEVAARRLLNQQIEASACDDPADVVERLGAIQAQDYAGACWAIGLRTATPSMGSVLKAITERRIVRTWPMRGTLHFVPAADVHWMLQLLTPRIIAGSAGRRKQLGLDDSTFAKAKKVIRRALRGGQATREKIYALLEQAGISSANQRGYHILWRLGQEGFLCFGPHEGRQPTFVLLDEWIPNPRKLSRDQSLAELASRYFAGHGPASAQDFVWWSGLTVADAKKGIALAGRNLEQVTVDGGPYWFATKSQIPSVPRSGAHLLPGFDEYLLGYCDRGAVLDARHSEKITPGGNGMFMPMMIRDGRVVGTWKKRIAGRGTALETFPFSRMRKTDLEAFTAVRQRYAQFLASSEP